MPRLTVSIDSTGDAKVSRAKRRVKVHSATFHVDDNTLAREEKNAKIRAAEKKKPVKKRAIHRARDLKHSDQGRGEEGMVDMWPEHFGSMLTSRVAKPFVIVHTITQTVFDRLRYPATSFCTFKPRTVVHKEIVLRGTLYAGNKNDDITVIREINGKPCHKIADCPFQDLDDTFESLFTEDGLYELTF